MSKIDKLLQKWRTRPVEVDKDEVFSVLKRYDFIEVRKHGSHVIVRHEKLVGKNEFGLAGELTIPIKGGQKVKGFYLKAILKAIDIITEDAT